MTKDLKQSIESKIISIKGIQIMLDRDLAELYQTDTRTLKQSVKRNSERFPSDFMFELEENDILHLVSQSVIPSKSYFGGSKPYAFTEQGVAMLASVLKNKTAVHTSITIIRAFVEMRRLIAISGNIFQRITKIEKRQVEYDLNFEKIFKALEDKDTLPAYGIFFDGQIFDAYKFVLDIMRKATNCIILIDNYVDDNTLQFFTKIKSGITILIYTQKITKQLQSDVEHSNKQYGGIILKEIKNNHDRFLIIDHAEMYLIGASLKDVGKKIFGFSRMDSEAIKLLSKLDINPTTTSRQQI
jgi:hypothetical protein